MQQGDAEIADGKEGEIGHGRGGAVEEAAKEGDVEDKEHHPAPERRRCRVEDDRSDEGESEECDRRDAHRNQSRASWRQELNSGTPPSSVNACRAASASSALPRPFIWASTLR